MALVVIGSAKGAPGATTTALAVAALWPRPVLLVDADPAGGDVAVRMPAPDGAPLDPDRGLVSLAAAGRNGVSAELMLAHAQRLAGGLEVVSGLRGPEQGAGVEPFWPALAAVSAAAPGFDVVADAGRLWLDSPVLPFVRAAHLVLLVCRPDVSSVVHVRERLGALVPQLAMSGPVRMRIGVVIVTGRDGERDAGAAADALGRIATPPDHVWRLAHDPVGATVFDGARVRRPERTDLARSAAALTAELAAVVAPFHVPGTSAQPGEPGRQSAQLPEGAG